MIYLDYAATTQMSTKSLAVYQQVAQQCYGNTNSFHDIGLAAADVLQFSREEIASILRIKPTSIYFTRGGTNSNQLAIQLLLRSTQKTGKHIITTSFEHASIKNYLDDLERFGDYHITHLPTNKYGEVELKMLQQAVKEETVLVIIQHVNSEIGTIQPIEEIALWLKSQDILFHCDGVQAFGKIPVNLQKLALDSYTISSHKVHGPKGVGALYLNPTIALETAILHTGTMDIPGIAAFVTAAKETVETIQEEAIRLEELRNKFIEGLFKHRSSLRTFTSSKQLPHIIGILFNTIPGDYAMLGFNQAGIAISTGSACSVGSEEPSPMMAAIGVSDQEAKHFIRLSIGNATKQNDLEKALEVCENIIKQWGNV